VPRLEKKADQLNEAMAYADEEQQAEIQSTLEGVYKRLDSLDANKVKARATTILHGLGFTKAMQKQTTKVFSGNGA
jgi:ATPase subunit of ABC transporter with duplicated ATPase domains